MRALVRPSCEEDCQHLLPNLREADRLEIEAHNADPSIALDLGYQGSDPCMTVEYQSEPIAMFGVTPCIGHEDIGLVWLLGSDKIKDIRIQFLRESREWLDQIGTNYDMLCNVVWEGNTLHHRWLKHLGFRFLSYRSPFYEFARFC